VHLSRIADRRAEGHQEQARGTFLLRGTRRRLSRPPAGITTLPSYPLYTTHGGTPLTFSTASVDDWPHLFPILRHVVDQEDSHCIDPSHPNPTLQRIWFAPLHYVYKVMLGDTVSGTFFLRANFDGRGKHIGNGSYMVHPNYRGQGIGHAMGHYSLSEAARLGFTAMQFNSVVSTNEKALRLWYSLDFRIIGTVPQAYRHRTHGLVDTHILYRAL
jgi:GNAT superfamily N-acetyltransferase